MYFNGHRRGGNAYRFNPAEAQVVGQEIGRIINSIIGEFTPPQQSAQTETKQAPKVLTPRVDVIDGGDTTILELELAGVPKENVKIAVDDDRQLRISGTKGKSEVGENAHWVTNERRYGDFERAFKLSDSIDASRISASFANGVLTIKLPKVEKREPQSTEIPIQ